MKVALLALDEAYAVDIGLRIISALLKRNGHKVDMLFNVIYSPGLSSFSTKTFNPEADHFQNINHAAMAVADFIRENHSDLLGISVSTNHFERAVRITNKVKQLKPDIFVVWGGIHPTVRSEECLRYADCICLGEGESQMLELVNRLSTGGNIYDISGLRFKDKNAIIINTVSSRITNMDSLPFQDYDLTSHYLIKQDLGIRSLNNELLVRIMPTFVTKVSPSYALSVTRGCPFSCGYCINSFINGLYSKQSRQDILRRRSVENVMAELSNIKERFPFLDSVFFTDDLLVFGDGNNKWLEDFSRQYKERISLPFMCLMHFSQVNDRTMELLVSAGLRQMSVGIESGSENTLRNLYNRYLMPGVMLSKARVINKYKRFVIPSYDVIVDNPYECEGDLRETLKLILRLPEPFNIGFYSLTFFPGVPLSEKARQDGLLNDELNQVYRKHYNDVNKKEYFNQLFLLSRYMPKWLTAYLLNNSNTMYKVLLFLFYRIWDFGLYFAQSELYQWFKNLHFKKKFSKSRAWSLGTAYNKSRIGGYGMNWNNIFEDDLRRQGSMLAAFSSCFVQNWYFINKIKHYLPKNNSLCILEAGAGTGYLAFYLSSLGHEVVAMDLDTDFMRKANSALKTNASIVRQDIRAYPYVKHYFDMIYNIGVMEHFKDEDIVKIFKNFKSAADVFIFAVPNFNIPYSYGDERYLSRRHWQRLLRLAGWTIKEVFSFNRYGLRKYLTGFVCMGTNRQF